MSENIFGKKHTAITRNLLAERGVEMTVEELEKTRKEAFAEIRKNMAEMGYDMTTVSDKQLFHMLCDAFNCEGNSHD